jgi:organic radical activating enzyme
MSKPVLPFVESMIIRPCNLSCEGCTTFSDLKWQGYVTWEQGKQSLTPWVQRLNIEAWGVMGGEPFMNPELTDWLVGVRSLMPDTQIRLTTNGLLVEKNWHVVELMQQLGNCILKLSQHIEDTSIDSMLDRLYSQWNWTPVHEYGLNRLVTDNKFRFQLSDTSTFYKTFKGKYENMMPHNNAPADAFKHCCQQRCPMIYKGRLFKCGTVALTPELLDRFDRPNWDMWQDYIVPGLGADCSDQDLEQFINNFGRPNSLCRQCPTDQDRDSVIEHKITVTRK